MPLKGVYELRIQPVIHHYSMSAFQTLSDKPWVISPDVFISCRLDFYQGLSAVVELCKLFDCSHVGERTVDVFEKRRALSFRSNAFERSISGAIGMLLVEEVVCMVINDREGLDQQLEVLGCRVFDIGDLMYGRQQRICGWCHNV